jgi:hypothetical protein
VTAMLPITAGEHAGWQRRAAATLAEILDASRDLPVIVWTVANVGSTLVGRISAPARAVQVKIVVFDVWRQALALGNRIETPGGAGSMFVRASTVRGAVRVAITAAVVDDDGEGWR